MKIESTSEKYNFTGLNLPIKPQVAGDCLNAIYKKNHRLTPELVLETARDKKNPLHKCFEWDDKIAAEEYRLNQAGKLIRCIVIEREVEGDNKNVRAFVNVQYDEAGNTSHNPFAKGDSVFIAMHDAMQDNFLRQYTVEQSLIELNRWMEKYKTLTELSSLYSAIKKEADKVQNKKRVKNPTRKNKNRKSNN